MASLEAIIRRNTPKARRGAPKKGRGWRVPEQPVKDAMNDLLVQGAIAFFFVPEPNVWHVWPDETAWQAHVGNKLGADTLPPAMTLPEVRAAVPLWAALHECMSDTYTQEDAA